MVETCEAEGCDYGAGHTGDCVSVEVGKEVLKLRTAVERSAARARRDSWTKTAWRDELEGLLAAGTSCLLDVGWVAKGATTWHRDRGCRSNRAWGSVKATLCLEVLGSRGGLKPCQRCAADEERWENAGTDWRIVKVTVGAAAARAGTCLGTFGGCGAEAVKGRLTCAEHDHEVSRECHEAGADVGKHAGVVCDGYGQTRLVETSKGPKEFRGGCGCFCHRFLG